MTQEIKWKVTLGAAEPGGLIVQINDQEIGHPLTPYAASIIVDYLRMNGQDIIDIVSEELCK